MAGVLHGQEQISNLPFDGPNHLQEKTLKT